MSLSARYYQENKERLPKKAHEKYQNLSKEEKEKSQQHGCERYISQVVETKTPPPLPVLLKGVGWKF